MSGRARASVSVIMLVAAAGAFAACAGDSGDGPPKIPALAECHVCGMTASDKQYASMVRTQEHALVFDSIECAVRHVRLHPEGEVWLSDFSGGGLRRAKDLTVVRADFPSPMGGGYAAFADGAVARREAEERNGIAGTWAEMIAGTAATQ